MTGISAIVHTRNEEANIANALGSLVGWVDELIVVDMESTDRTVEIAVQFGADVHCISNAGYADPAREAAVLSAKNDWVVYLDADELMPIRLARLLKAKATAETADCYFIPRLNYMFGKPVMHTGWGPNQDRQLRFFRKESVFFSPDVHTGPRPRPGMRVEALHFRESSAIIHFNYLDSSQFLSKLDRYTDFEAREGMRDRRPVSGLRMVWQGVREFLLRFIARQGFRDGLTGYYLTVLMIAYRTIELAKIAELREARNRGENRLHYQQIADKILAEYGQCRR